MHKGELSERKAELRICVNFLEIIYLIINPFPMKSLPTIMVNLKPLF